LKERILSLVTVVAVCIGTPAPLAAPPTGADLLAACARSLATGDDSIEGKMCAWYTVPCNCGADKDTPRVCLPDSLQPNQLARDVIDGLESQPPLQAEGAARAAALILSEKYPCPAAADR
jgi:hypothetical protein